MILDAISKVLRLIHTFECAVLLVMISKRLMVSLMGFILVLVDFLSNLVTADFCVHCSPNIIFGLGSDPYLIALGFLKACC